MNILDNSKNITNNSINFENGKTFSLDVLFSYDYSN